MKNLQKIILSVILAFPVFIGLTWAGSFQGSAYDVTARASAAAAVATANSASSVAATATSTANSASSVAATAQSIANSASAVSYGNYQTYQDVTASRAIGGGPYTNATGRPITVIWWGTNSVADGTIWGQVGGVTVVQSNSVGIAGYLLSVSFVVPPGQTYALVNNGGGVNTTTKWFELR